MPNCNICNKHFSSKMSLWMHYTRSLVHRKGSIYYHNPNLYERDKKKTKNKEIDLTKNRKITEWSD